jgi:uncharacterized hydrophobic protein (TIGR00271 family)
MYQLRVACSEVTAPSVIESLQTAGADAITVHVGADTIWGRTVIHADIRDDMVQSAISTLSAVDNSEDIVLRLSASEDVQLFRFASGQATVIDDDSVEGLGLSGASSVLRRLTRVDIQYLLLMISAAIIAAAGLVADLPIAIVGAMAISPDLGRLNAMAFSLINGAMVRFLRGTASLAIGMLVAVATSFLWTLFGLAMGVEDPLEAIPASLASLVTELDVITLTVALAAGIAAMVVFITDRGTSAVGVGVSITTIPAAAYAGLAIADGDLASAGAALTVLLVNVVCVVGAGVVTGLWFRHHLKRRAMALRNPAPM